MTSVARPQAKEGVLRVTPYAGSEAKPGGGQLINISSNESAFGASAAAQKAYTDAATNLRRYPEVPDLPDRCSYCWRDAGCGARG
jgi:histidinol-phosphate/aromatic aminotransferase/cobyric acid decarboxylase-like protein